MSLIIIWYFFHNYFLASALASTSINWPLPRSQPRTSYLGLGLEVLASFNITDSQKDKIIMVTEFPDRVCD